LVTRRSVFLGEPEKMNRMKPPLVATMLIAYVGSASAVGPGYLGNLTGNTYNIGNTFSTLAYGSSFVDTYLFDIAPTSVNGGYHGHDQS
jgi:hypothetical protein